MKRIGFLPRLGAAVIDWIFGGFFAGGLAAIFGVFGLGAGGAIGLAVEELAEIESALEAAGLGAGIGAIVGLISGFVIGYFLYSLIEASPGKMVLGYIVGNEDGSAGDLSLYLKRWVIKNASSVFSMLALLTGLVFLEPIGSLIGVVMFFGCFLALTEQCQALHDKIAKTAIYNKQDLI